MQRATLPDRVPILDEMTSQSHDAPDEPPEDVFGDPARSFAVPDPDWSPESASAESAPAGDGDETAPLLGDMRSADMRLASGDIPGMNAESDSGWITPAANYYYAYGRTYGGNTTDEDPPPRTSIASPTEKQDTAAEAS